MEVPVGVSFDSVLDEESWTQVGETGFSMADTEYEPSIRDDISEMLPFATDQDDVGISENYSTDVIVQSAWKSRQISPKVICLYRKCKECWFWKKFQNLVLYSFWCCVTFRFNSLFSSYLLLHS